jgi:2-oxoglutarate ferredoxin oxidoreductase subunit beta
VEPPFDLCRLTEAAGASFVARGTAGHIRELEKLIKKGLEHKGFSFIEAVVPCPTEYGRRNISGNVLKMLEDERSRSIAKSKADKLSAADLAGKIVTGVLFEDPKALEFQEAYAAAAHVQAEAAAKLRALAVEKPPMGQQK